MDGEWFGWGLFSTCVFCISGVFPTCIFDLFCCWVLAGFLSCILDASGYVFYCLGMAVNGCRWGGVNSNICSIDWVWFLW